jgi:hypothetical protein
MREGTMYNGYIIADKIKMNTASKRRITIRKLNDLKKSIQELPEMMYLRPIVLNKDNMILGGNMRYKAMMDLGVKEIPFIRVEDLTQEQEQMFIEKDNAHWGDWSLPEYHAPKFEHKESKLKTIKINASLDEHDYIIRDLNTIQQKMGLHDNSQTLRMVLDHFLNHNYI